MKKKTLPRQDTEDRSRSNSHSQTRYHVPPIFALRLTSHIFISRHNSKQAPQTSNIMACSQRSLLLPPPSPPPPMPPRCCQRRRRLLPSPSPPTPPSLPPSLPSPSPGPFRHQPAKPPAPRGKEPSHHRTGGRGRRQCRYVAVREAELPGLATTTTVAPTRNGEQLQVD